MKTRTLLVLALCATLGFASCDTPSTDGKKTDDPVTADVYYKVDGGKDMLSLFTIKATYLDASNQAIELNVDELPWTMTLNKVDVPFNAVMELTLTPKNNYPDKSTYTVGIGEGITYKTSDGRTSISNSANTSIINKSQIEKYVEAVMGREYKTTIEIE